MEFPKNETKIDAKNKMAKITEYLKFNLNLCLDISILFGIKNATKENIIIYSKVSRVKIYLCGKPSKV